MNKNIFKSEFARNALTIFTGSAIAQAIPFFVEPILTRLYTPEEFAILALYISTSSLFVIIATGRYELAVMLPKTDKKSVNVVGLSVLMAIGVSLFSFLIVGLFNHQICSVLKNQSVGPFLYLIPFSVLLVGVYQALNYWASRHKRFSNVIIARVTQTVTNSGLTVGTGFYGLATSGLIGSYLIGQIVAVIPLLGKFIKNDRKLVQEITKTEIKSVAKEYSDFPKINSLHAFSDILQQSLLIFLISYFFSQAMVGYYSRTFRIIAAPVALIGSAIGQVFFQKASQMYAQGENIQPFVKRTMLNLAMIAVPGFGLLMLFGDTLFAFALGEPWRQAGVYAQVLAPWMCMNFIVGPVSVIPLIVGKQKQVFLYSLIGNTLILASIFYGGYYAKNIIHGFYMLSALMVVYYATLFLWILKISGTKKML